MEHRVTTIDLVAMIFQNRACGCDLFCSSQYEVYVEHRVATFDLVAMILQLLDRNNLVFVSCGCGK